MSFPKIKISVKNLMNLMNLMRGCKSTSYNQKSLINLIKFIKTSYLLRNANFILMRLMRANELIISYLISFIASSILLSHFHESAWKIKIFY